MLIAGICFIVGAILTASAFHLPQLVVGRIVLGAGVGGVFSQLLCVKSSEHLFVHVVGSTNLLLRCMVHFLNLHENSPVLMNTIYVTFDALRAGLMH